ncbi:MAG TPA: glycosyltransferase family A protein [Nevskiaceae bacterium]|nr:glycosyltransferase family A protein [Nevskiaceae bacterium]
MNSDIVMATELTPITNPEVSPWTQTAHDVGGRAVLSVITPVHAPDRDHLTATYDSLVSQELPDGWDIEWMLQEDGTTGVVNDVFRGEHRVKPGMAPHSDTATARNLALARSSGRLIKTLDQDDVLPPGALQRDIEAFIKYPGVQWTCALTHDLLPDGSTQAPDNHFPAGLVKQDAVFDAWRARDHRLAVHPASSCYRRQAAVAMGGWMALRHAGDTGLLLTTSTLWPGFYIGDPGLLWRRTPTQTSSQPVHKDPEERRLRNSLIEERVRALQDLRGAIRADG